MVSKIVLALILGIMSVGCISAGSGEKTAITLDDVIGFTMQKLADTAVTVNTLQAQVVTNAAALEEARSTVASLEAMIGPADTNGDGEISAAEAAEFYAKATTSTDPQVQALATNSDVWKKFGSLLAAAAITRKYGHKLPPQLQWLTMFFGSTAKKPPTPPPAPAT